MAAQLGRNASAPLKLTFMISVRSNHLKILNSMAWKNWEPSALSRKGGTQTRELKWSRKIIKGTH
jgi:hypothetical protein